MNANLALDLALLVVAAVAAVWIIRDPWFPPRGRVALVATITVLSALLILGLIGVLPQ